MADWQRFESYAAKVKSLGWDEEDDQGNQADYSGPPSDSVIAQLCLLRPSHAVLLPQLREVEWSVKSDKALLHLLLFLSNSVTKSTCRVRSGCSSQALSKVFELIEQGSFPFGEIFFVHPFSIHQIEDPLSNLLKGQRKLMATTISGFCSSEKIISVLGGIDIKEVMMFKVRALAANKVARWKFCPDSFRKLEVLHFCASLTQAAKAFEIDVPPLLDTVRLQIPRNSPINNANLHLCLTNLAVACPKLVELSLELFSSTVPTEQIHLDSFAPLLQCHELEYLSVGHNRPIVVAEENIVQMAEAWPALKKLSMTPDPIETSDTATSLSTIKSFSTHFRHTLHHLGLFLSVDRAGMTLNTTPANPFQELVTFNVGTSVISPSDSMGIIAFFTSLLSYATEL
ncbi:hypothetical protein FRB95_005889 [Tulasnella sp. JGI-2019a]|nr:hypothetical protein FRB95_005889 [Tulasnella sp. JGI-2019a]